MPSDTPADVKFNYRNLTFDEVAQFLTAKQIPNKCPACDLGTTSILAEPDRLTASFYAMHPTIPEKMPEITIDKNKAMLSIVTECENCGFRRHFSSRLIFKWLESKKMENS